ncbi:MAG: hypothetical protein LC104_17620 [Bacteroidales bacterium]|nr:hypothetical protein [Bacteroidales bacterium]
MAKAKAEPVQTPNKMQMVEAALDALGEESAPSDIQPWIQSTYSAEIDRQMISSYASQIRKKRRDSSGGKGLDGISSGLASRDLATIQELIRKVGA